MLLQTIQQTLSQLLAPARTDVRTAPMAVTKDGRIVPIGTAHADRFITEIKGQTGGTVTGSTGRVCRGHGYGSKVHGIVMNWLGHCAAVMNDTFGPTNAGNGVTASGPAGASQHSRSAKT